MSKDINFICGLVLPSNLSNEASTWADIGTTAMYNVHDTSVRGCVGYFHTTYIHTYLGLAPLQSDPVWNHSRH